MKRSEIKKAIGGRSMFVWQLGPILAVDGGPEGMAQKAAGAKCSAVWIKVAVGQQEYEKNAPHLPGVLEAMKDVDIKVWGWHEPRCLTLEAAESEVELVGQVAEKYELAGVLMDAEAAAGGSFFQGGPDEASLYAERLRDLVHEQGRPLALCSHDIPQNFPGFPFESFARFADVNVPQVYYGAGPSVSNRLERAIKANADVPLPFVPVGAGWVGDAGGCASDSACAERATIFAQLVREYGFIGHAFWHWVGAPLKLWNVLMHNRLT